jgi:putative ABC transport system permease protein
MNFFRQFFAILGVNLSGATKRLGAVLTVIVGVACAVGVLVSMLAMGSGLQRQALQDVRADRVILSSTGARDAQSSIPRDVAVGARDLPGIKKDVNGAPIAIFTSLVPIEAHRRLTGIRIFFPLVGTTANLAQYRPEIRFTEGRMFQPGLHELIASNPCRRQFAGFEIDDRRSIRGTDWVVVGHFDQGRTLQCVVYTDVDVLMSTFNRNTYNQVAVMLQSPGDFTMFRDALRANPTMHVDAQHESDAAQENSKQLKGILDFASYFVGTIMAIGATLGAVNSLYAIVDSRRREMGTLRAIGFSPGVVVASILCESLIFSLPGALLGCALAWLFFNGLSASPFGYNFRLAVTPSLALNGLAWALGMGLVGGLLPALRSARQHVATALRAA